MCECVSVCAFRGEWRLRVSLGSVAVDGQAAAQWRGAQLQAFPLGPHRYPEHDACGQVTIRGD